MLVAARGLVRRTTWYLASDQFAFLTFADDLARGTVFHDDTTVRLMARDGREPAHPVDAYYQTYIWRDGRLYSRYPPGYPLLLAAAGLAGGEVARHALNPLLYLVLLVALAALVHRLVRPAGPAVAAGAAAAIAWALLVVPAEIHYWGITVVRDLPAHLLGIVALATAWRRRFVLSGLALGVACSIRPDAILYAFGVAPLAWRAGAGLGTAVAAGATFLAGLAPLLAYNTITQGHPLAFTQGSEFRFLLGARRPTSALAGMLPDLGVVSGGGFRLSNLPRTLPAHVRHLVDVFGLFLLPALGAVVWSAVRAPGVALAFGPYALVALLFYSCWGHGDARYLVGVVLALLALAAIGTTLGAAWLAAPTRRPLVRVLALCLLAGALVMAPRLRSSDMATRIRPLEVAVGAGALATGTLALVPPLAVIAAGAAPLVPALAFGGMGMDRVVRGSGTRDPFQHEAVVRARATVEATIPAGALVVTSPSVGRPAENITHYTHAESHYAGEMTAMGSSVADAARNFLAAGRAVFVLVAVKETPPLATSALEEVERRSGEALYDWFCDPRRATDGAVLYRVTSAPDVTPRAARPPTPPGARP